MKLFKQNSWAMNVPPLLALFLVVLARGYPALTPGFTFSAPSGDGLSTMAWMNEIIQTYKNFGLAQLMTPIDLIVPTGSGGGLTTPNTFYHFWKLLFIGLEPFLSLDNIYDLILLTGIFLTGLMAYFLALSFNMNRPAAFLTALFTISLENIDRRLGGHMFLAFWFAPLLMIYLVKSYVEKPKYLTSCFLSLAVVFSFLQCEYYTYFGGIFACTLGLSLVYGHWAESKQSISSLNNFKDQFHLKKIAPQILLGLVCLVTLMLLLFPSLIQPYDKNITFKSRGLFEFNLYSLRNPASLFAPGIEVLRDWIPYHSLGVKGEMTFRLGIFFWGGLAYLLKSSWSSLTSLEKRSIKALAVAGLVCLLFAFTPGSFPWLSKLTFHLFPMFRVGVRSVLFTDMAAILVFGIVIHSVFRQSLKKSLIIPILLTFLAFWDVQHPDRGLFGTYQTYPLPQTYPTLETLKASKPGWVLEIPMWNNKDVFEFDSDQNYRRIQHDKFLVNIVRSHQNSPYTIKIGALTEIVNGLDSPLMEFAQTVGVQYLLVESYMDADGLLPFLESGELTLLQKDERFVLYGLNHPNSFSKENYMVYLDTLETDPLVK